MDHVQVCHMLSPTKYTALIGYTCVKTIPIKHESFLALKFQMCISDVWLWWLEMFSLMRREGGREGVEWSGCVASTHSLILSQ